MYVATFFAGMPNGFATQKPVKAIKALVSVLLIAFLVLVSSCHLNNLLEEYIFILRKEAGG